MNDNLYPQSEPLYPEQPQESMNEMPEEPACEPDVTREPIGMQEPVYDSEKEPVYVPEQPPVQEQLPRQECDPWEQQERPVADGFCPYCGSSVEETFEYCPKCGRKLK